MLDIILNLLDSDMDSPFWIYCIGLSAQILFTLRVLSQWYISEKKGRSESPSIFWLFSIVASMIMCFYGVLRNDATIILGEFFAYYIYMWNIGAKGLYRRVPALVPIIQSMIPPVTIVLLLQEFSGSVASLFAGYSMPTSLFVLGIIGQFVFKSRFIFQFVYSIRRKQSLMPLGFWVIAVVGSVLIIIYSLIRHDWVLLLGQFSIIPSLRNIFLILNSRKNEY